MFYNILFQQTFDWLVGLEDEQPEVVESVDEAIAREVAQVKTIVFYKFKLSFLFSFRLGGSDLPNILTSR